MGHFILPITVESRKILFLDLFPPTAKQGDYQFPQDDEYITELPQTHKRTILSISKTRYIQSLVEEADDFRISELTTDIIYSETQQLLTISFNKSGADENREGRFKLGRNLLLHAFITEISIDLVLENLSFLDPLAPVAIRVLFVFTPTDAQNYSYGSGIKIHMVNRDNILLTGFDFGSEASQIRDGNYMHSGEGTTVEQHPVPIFTDIRHRLGNTLNANEEYLQFESEKLYKSVFFLKKKITLDKDYDKNNLAIPSAGLNVLTLNAARNKPEFVNEWSQVPNMKLVHDNPDLTNQVELEFQTPSRAKNENLTQIRASVYAALLREMLISYLVKRVNADMYLRFTLLVPNIYTSGMIKESRGIIRDIITDTANSFHLHVKGLEISCLSESDASFLGYLASTNIKRGEFYIVIDCGKGTTDISVVQSDEKDARAIRSIYRNGFAGAGNLVTFAVMESAFTYIKQLAVKQTDGLKHYNAFVQAVFAQGARADLRNVLFDIAESWKKNYSVNTPKADIEKVWEGAASGTYKMASIFSASETPERIMDVLQRIDRIFDWDGHIQNTISSMVEKINITLEPVARKLLKQSNCGGILLSGRGLLFKPLETAIASAIRNIKGLENSVVFDTKQFNLKEICLTGVFVRNVLSYNEIVSIPIEVKKGELGVYIKNGSKPVGIIKKLIRFFQKVVQDDSETFDEYLNRIVVSNMDFANCQFLIGGNIYQPLTTEGSEFESACLVRSREGYFIRATDSNGSVRILPLDKAGVQHNSYMNEDFIIRSLYPGWSHKKLVDAIINL